MNYNTTTEFLIEQVLDTDHPFVVVACCNASCRDAWQNELMLRLPEGAKLNRALGFITRADGRKIAVLWDSRSIDDGRLRGLPEYELIRD